MKDGFVKVAALSPKHRVCDCSYNVKEAAELVKRAADAGAAIAVLPELSVSAYTAADSILTPTLLEASERAVAEFAKLTARCDLISFIGAPIRMLGAIYDCAVAVCHGEILGAVPRVALNSDPVLRVFSPAQMHDVCISFASQDIPVAHDIIFTSSSADLRIGAVIGRDPLDCDDRVQMLSRAGANVIVNLSALPKTVGSYAFVKDTVKVLSMKYSVACITATAGEGESGTDALYMPHNVIAEGGKILATNPDFTDEALCLATLDTSLFARQRIDTVDLAATSAVLVEFDIGERETKITPPPRSPFVTEDASELRARCAEIFEIQSRALAARMSRAYAKCAVLGVSGGLDSTLALLVAARAAELNGLPPTAVKAITMPCFGTTARTKGNAERLSLALGADLRVIDIKRSVNQHFEDIGHSADDYSVVYENAQARERTQIIMDIANAQGGLVVGTGDLSELALGWATYNGDHMSMYGVNSGVPKTMMRHIVSYCADKAHSDGNAECAEILRDVLATPVSPELLPPKDGEIAQCTEGIVGPYELHDFFLYYLIRYSYSPRKIYRLAKAAFDGVYTADVIKGWLKVFFRRFYSQQFKRSCLPDGPAVGSVSVSPRGALVLPSDASSAIWLAEIDALD